MSNAWGYVTGTAGTLTVPVGAIVTHVRAESRNAAATMVMFGGASVLLDGTSQMQFELDFPPVEDPTRPGQILAPVAETGANTIVFTNTVSCFVGFIRR